MFGSLYVVLFDNGTAKVGMSSDVGKRVNAHTKAAFAMGVGVSSIYFTEPMSDTLSREDQLIDAFSKKHKVIAGKEFFGGADIMSVEDAIKRTRFVFNRCKELSSNTIKGETWVVAKAFRVGSVMESAVKDQRSNYGPLHEKLCRILQKAGGTLTEGVLCNRLRSHDRSDVLDALGLMAEKGAAVKTVYEHPNTHIDVVKWTMK